jgi:parallel beta-helix repeat protein
VRSNTASNNGRGYLVIDGANNNTLQRNAATGSQFYDLELTADTYRFGFLTPASYHNTVKEKNRTVKDCGNGNRILQAATLVDTTADPCF